MTIIFRASWFVDINAAFPQHGQVSFLNQYSAGEKDLNMR